MDFRDLTNDVILKGMATFGREIVYQHKSGLIETIIAIPEQIHIEISPDGNPVATNHPTLDINLKDLSLTPLKGDKIIYDNNTYRVTDSQEDGWGASKLILSLE